MEATTKKFKDKFAWTIYCLCNSNEDILKFMDKNYEE